MNLTEIELIKKIQANIPIEPQPFQHISQELSTSENTVLDILTKWKESGILRRVGAILKHQKAGFTANGMSVWNVPEEQIEDVGKQIVTFSEVGHCYQRPKFQGWPYNVFAMIHSQTKDQVKDIAQKISLSIGIDDYDILFTVREFKKTSMTYFTEEIPTF